MNVPRIVIVTRPTELDALVAEHGTVQQARFVLGTLGRPLDDVERRHASQLAALETIARALPSPWRRVRLDRSDLDRYVFEPDDVIVPVGQDGLVANVAKYLDGQPVVGINPDPASYEGVLVTHRAQQLVPVVEDVLSERASIAERTMVEANLDDGQRLLALNEVFLGHRSHQSARYELRVGEAGERQSSSGIIVTSGTGATGWARSIRRERRDDVPLPGPTEPRLAYFVREAFPGSGFAVAHTGGVLGGEPLVVRSEMNDGGVVFGDGIEDDRLAFAFGRVATVGIAGRRLRLVA